MTTTISDSSIDVVEEQDGAAERELKQLLTAIFETRSDVRIAYLARIRYGSDATPVVALCLGLTGPPDEIVKAAGNVFHRLFSVHQFMDIIPMSAALEHKIGRVCMPFYVAFGTA